MIDSPPGLVLRPALPAVKGDGVVLRVDTGVTNDAQPVTATVAAGKATTTDLALQQAADVSKQLTTVEWAMNLPGSDADMVIVDMNKETVITNETTYTKVGWTPYHDRKVKGVPVRTIVRGKTVMLDGKIVGKPGDGQLVKPLR